MNAGAAEGAEATTAVEASGSETEAATQAAAPSAAAQPSPEAAPYLSATFTAALQEVQKGVGGTSVLDEDSGKKMLNLSKRTEADIPASYRLGSASDGKPILPLTNFRIHERTSVTKLQCLGGEPGQTLRKTQPALAAMGTVVAQSSADKSTIRLQLPEVTGWKISEMEGLEGAWISTPVAWYRLLDPDSSYSQVFETTKMRMKLCSSIIKQMEENPQVGPVAAARRLYEESSGSAKETPEWWLWHMREDRSFLIQHLAARQYTVETTHFCKVLRDVLFSNLPCSYPAAPKDKEVDANPYSAIWNKYLDQKQAGTMLPIPGADSEDQQAVRRLTDRHVMVVRGKHRGRTGYIIGAGKGHYIVSIDGEQCQIKGAHLELHDEDVASSGCEDNFDDEEECGNDTNTKRMPRVDPDMEEVTGTRLVQRRVIIREGKLSGQIGVVGSSGHGFYCVRARGVQVKLRRREFEVCEEEEEEDAKTGTRSDAPAERKKRGKGKNGDMEEWIGKQAQVKASGRYRGKVGLIVDHTVGILTIAFGDDRVLAFVDDVDNVGPAVAKGTKRSAGAMMVDEEKLEVRQPSSFTNMRVIIKAGKHEGLIGTVTSVDHGWHCVLIDGNDEVRVRSKDIELYYDEPLNADAAQPSDEAQSVVIKAGKHQGRSGFVKSSQANGWYTLDVGGTSVSMRALDFEIVGGKSATVVDVANVAVASSSIAPGTKVVIVGGPDDGKVGVVNKALNNTWYMLDMSAGEEMRVRRSDFREFHQDAAGVADGPRDGDNDAPAWVRIKSGKNKGQRGRVIDSSASWTSVEVEGTTVKVRTSECEPDEDQKAPAGQSDEDMMMDDGSRRKRLRGDDEDAAEDNDDDSMPCEVGATVRVRAGEHIGKIGQIVKTGHGWINVKIGEEDVRVRGKDIEPIKREATSAEGMDVSPGPKSNVTIKTGKHKGQVGKVLSSGHGWLWVQLGKEEIRLRRRDVAVTK